jgi:O-antigen ligase
MKIKLTAQYFSYIFIVISLLWAPRGFFGADARFLVVLFDVVIIGLFLFSVVARPVSSLIQIVLIVAIAYFGIRGFDSNVPDAEVAYLGFRKSVLFLMALYAGYALKGIDVTKISGSLLLIGVLMLGVAIKQFFFWSDFDDRLLDSLAAGSDTHQLFGQTRAVGLFASPFALGMLGAVILSIVFVFKRRVVVVFALIVGFGLVFFSLTRINFIAGAAALIVGYVFSRFSILKAIKLSGASVVAIVFFWIFFGDIAREIIFNLDNRVIGRLDSWHGAEAAFAVDFERFFYGFGLGSAGDALGDKFSEGWHITSHNIFLKYLFEGGLIGLILFVTALCALGKAMLAAPSSLRSVGLAIMAVILVNGVTGGTVDAMPTAAFAAILIGRISAIGRTESLRSKIYAGPERVVDR